MIAETACAVVFVVICAQPARAPRPTTAPTLQAPEAPSDPDAVRALDDALAKLRAIERFRVQLDQVIELLDYRFEAKGTFVWARDDRLRLELELTILNDRHQLLEVCDGKQWHRRLTLLHGQIETLKTDVTKVREELAKPGLPARIPGVFMAGRLGLGGIVPLVESVRETFVLQVAKPDDRRFAKRPHEIELTGHVRRDGLRVLLRRRPNDPVSLDQVPPYVPVRCRIVLDRRTGWPVHVRLLGRNEKAYVALRFSKIQTNPSLPSATFAYKASSKEPVGDQTPMLVAEIQRQRAAASRPTRAPTTVPSSVR